MENVITYLKPVSLFKRIFGIIVFVFAFYVVVYQNFIVGFFMISFAVYLASSVGSQINLDKSTHRNIWSIFSIHIGKWEPNPDFEYISVFKGKESQTINSLGASASFVDDVYLVNIFYERNRHKTFYRTKDKDDAFRIAKHFKLVLDIDILDATDDEQKWVD